MMEEFQEIVDLGLIHLHLVGDLRKLKVLPRAKWEPWLFV